MPLREGSPSCILLLEPRQNFLRYPRRALLRIQFGRSVFSSFFCLRGRGGSLIETFRPYLATASRGPWTRQGKYWLGLDFSFSKRVSVSFLSRPAWALTRVAQCPLQAWHMYMSSPLPRWNRRGLSIDCSSSHPAYSPYTALDAPETSHVATSKTAAFPVIMAGRLPKLPFRGLLSVHSRYDPRARGPTKVGLSTKSLSHFVTSMTLKIATGWSKPVAGRVFQPAR
jgi:hypothetical protein